MPRIKRKRGRFMGIAKIARSFELKKSFLSHSNEQIVDVEAEFLHAAEFGDIPTVKRLLSENVDLNIDCSDALGRTALRLAVKNEHLEVVELLLDKSSSRHVYEAVLQAISAGHIQIAECILKHKRYLELWKERRRLGDDEHFFKTQFEESQFSPDITPLILASQKNQYEIVQLLLMRGETIAKPHKFNCMCQDCVNKMKFDELRSAKHRLNAYRGLASEAYISLSSKDPILTAFQLGRELKQLSSLEKYFMVTNVINEDNESKLKVYIQSCNTDATCYSVIQTSFPTSTKLHIARWLYLKLSCQTKGEPMREYQELCDNLSEYVVKLLDRVRTQEELEIVLNKTGSSNKEKYKPLARFKLALKYEEKKFVASPSCQQRLIRSWYYGMEPFQKANWARRIVMILIFILIYPFIAICQVIAPNAKYIRVLSYPCVKFALNSLSFIAFLVMIVVSTVESSIKVSDADRLSQKYPNVYEKYTIFRNSTGENLKGEDIPLRQIFPETTALLMSIWVLGLIVQECSQLYRHGLKCHCSDYYNIVDVGLLFVYISSFTLKFLVMFKVDIAIEYLQKSSMEQILENPKITNYYLYWLTADRFYWNPWDPINISEGLFAIGNILSFARVSYLLPANEALGPLQISLGRMLKDILKFLALFMLIFMAFMIGLQNLYWYYNIRASIELEDRNLTFPAADSFGDFIETFRTMFWSLFGRGEPDIVRLGGYNNHVTEDIGYNLFGAYNIAMVIVLLNMLIAMMAQSFQAITEDSDREWKFSRSQLYMDYIGSSTTLPVPLNLLEAPRGIISVFKELCCSKTSNDDSIEDEAVHRERIIAHQNGIHAFGATNGVSAVEAYEANMVDESPSNRNNETALNFEENKTYPKVMERIIQRYIFDIQREEEVTEDDFEEIKQDISSFRYEMLNHLSNGEQAHHAMQEAIASIGKHILTIREDMYSEGGTKKPFTGSFQDIIMYEKESNGIMNTVEESEKENAPNSSI
ncbi:hypothetical protein CHS0354_027146 [Potamilus streckersoni]|uniref:Transient receptor ion channel domain-containing protein n=1 Tax=Potamilus streckersoni TaxID=2493646 RepID=A0AAE0TJB0_9BIVA|nr:hypothetical protein CHS0354_027146 [Potamilus streckersoni]